MHDLAGVGEFEGAQDADGDLQQVGITKALHPRQPVFQRFSVNVLQNQKAAAIELLEAVHLYDVGVIQGALPPALIQKALLDFLPPCKLSIQELYGNRSAEMDVARQPDFRHAAAPEPALENKCSTLKPEYISDPLLPPLVTDSAKQTDACST